MSEIYSLYLMELLMHNNGTLSVEVAWRYFISQYPQVLDNFQHFETFLLSQSFLFDVRGDFVCLKGVHNQERSPFFVQTDGRTKSFPFSGLQPHVQTLGKDSLAAEAEAVKYFQKQLNKRNEQWVQIKSLAGHLSQASAHVRAIVGPQSDFPYFLKRHPLIFEVQGDLVGLQEELKTKYYPRLFQNSNSSLSKSSRKMRPMSVYIPSSGPLQQDNYGISDYLNVHQVSQEAIEIHTNSKPCFNLQNSHKKSSQTVLITLADYLAIMWLRQTIASLSSDSSNQLISLISLTKELINAPINIRNTIGWTQIEAMEFLKNFDQMFDVDEVNCKSRYLREQSLTFVITDSNNTNSLSLTNKKGIVFCVSRSWGIIDLGQHEHVFFDRSLFRHINDLTQHFNVSLHFSTLNCV